MIEAILSLLREWAMVSMGREIAGRTIRRVSETALLYVVVALFGISAVVFFYIFAFRWLSDRLDEEGAAAILCGANLLVIALILGARAISSALRRQDARSERTSELDALADIGLALEGRLREKAPTVALVALIAGLAVGARPELLDLFKSSRKAKNSSARER